MQLQSTSELDNFCHPRLLVIYAITLNQAGHVNINLSDKSAPAYFAIYNSKKERLDYLLSSYSKQFQPGTYYIQVYPNSWGDQY
ncbi:hypothetical protein [Lysinibacillus antri]|uniref:Uncharacterized protein n=1 Tax=Lysinibacillus antri TaxID=2498145 RepID=A0A432L934_9BACI|nr:hypothetical protein [Lysinibacillus antri]RUL49807.1 hypothetical protein EK386_14720 [Lysinibacillus antri]